ncbi:YheC/YheD family protein [Alkalibacillus haloalkaliphilus]|uniref:YheC/YheD family protein n=1 Tax=Alkalibacillus haloalkaliphilus TaxID=94136 RepID=UPI00030C1F41|nr:YheC/YheD family protein [Alkalibacillus haloalkaliphilus]
MEKIVINTVSDKNTIYLNDQLAQKLDIPFLKDTSLRFGYKIKDLDIKLDNKLEDNQILLSSNIVSSLNIPTTCNYDVKVEDNEIVLGPIIGIYAGQRMLSLKRRVRLMQGFADEYNQVNGVIFVFCYDSLNKDNLTVEGFYYEPQRKIWVYTTLPYPSMVFKRGVMNKTQREYLSSIYKNKMFNYKYFEKWDMYERLKNNKSVNSYLPLTKIYNNSQDALDLLYRYNDIYIKPIAGKQGAGIFNVYIDKQNNFVVKTTANKQTTVNKYNTNDEIISFFNSNLEPKKFIIQETIDLKFKNRVMDFRLGYDKGIDGNWNNIMFVTRVSGDNSIVSNYKAGGKVVFPSDALKNYYNADSQQIKNLKEELLIAGNKIIEALELTSKHFGKVALDLAIDKDFKIWLIEVNLRFPDDTLENNLDESHKTYKKIKSTNLLYCKYLSGFGSNVKTMPTIINHNNKLSSQKNSFKVYFYGEVQKVGMRKALKTLGNELGIETKALNLKHKRIVRADIYCDEEDLYRFIEQAKDVNEQAYIKSISIISKKENRTKD